MKGIIKYLVGTVLYGSYRIVKELWTGGKSDKDKVSNKDKVGNKDKGGNKQTSKKTKKKSSNK